MTAFLIPVAVFATVGLAVGIFARPWIGLAALTLIGAAIAGSRFLPSDSATEMDPKNQALLTAIVFGVPAFAGWVAGALIRLEQQETARPGRAP